MKRRAAPKPELLSARLPGHQHEYGGYPIYRPERASGELPHFYWYRHRVSVRMDWGTVITDARCWCASVQMLGKTFSVFAVIDDFGNLVRVER